MKLNLTPILLVLLTGAGSALAASHYKDEYIRQYDQNGDALLSLAEFNAARRARFDATDTNDDDVVSADEYAYEWEDRLDVMIEKERAGRVKQAHRRFDSLDANDDGIIAADEFNASGDRIFTSFDHNDDALIDAADAEIEQAQANADGKAETRRERRRSFVRMPSSHSRSGFFEMYDTDADETVSRSEFDVQRRAAYRFMDYDRNSRVDEDEYVAEYEDRLDNAIERSRRGQVRQAYVRFDSLDADDDGKMTFEEYQQSGHRSFARWDTNKDEIVSADDPMPERSRPNDADSRQASNTGQR